MKQYNILNIKKWSQGGIVALLLVCFSSASLADKPVVLASIHPMGMIAKAVAGDAFDVRVLLPPSSSPHDYALRFSDRRALIDADLILWVGPGLESPLAKLLTSKNDEKSSRVLQAGLLPDLTWPNEGEEGGGEKEAAAGHYHDEYRHDAHAEHDPHIWLNPDNAVLVAKALLARMIELEPKKERELVANFAEFAANIAELVENTKEKVSPLKASGFLVVHDGYRHWVDFYQLNQLGSVRLGSGAERGLKHRAELIAMQGKVSCVFSEPQWPLAWAEQVAEPLNAKIGLLDPMGQGVALDRFGYEQLMSAMTESLLTCLATDQERQSINNTGLN